MAPYLIAVLCIAAPIFGGEFFSTDPELNNALNSRGYRDIAFGNGRYVRLTVSGEVEISLSGQEWHEIAEQRYFERLKFAGERFFAKEAGGVSHWYGSRLGS